MELVIRANNPYYNPRRYMSQPQIPHPRMHIPECHPQLANGTAYASDTRVAEKSDTRIASESPTDRHFAEEVPEATDAGGERDLDSDDDGNSGIHPQLLREMANSPIHLLTHRPFNRFCDACVMGKIKTVHSFVEPLRGRLRSAVRL